jgi:6-phosphogluconolactonase
MYRFDSQRGKLTPHDPPFAAIKPGSGPRHMVFRPDHRFAYVTNELNSTITAFAYDAKAGVLREIQSVSTLPEHFEGANTTAEIDVHPSGKWLYVSNRGHNSVATFTIDRSKGTLAWVEEQMTGGSTPRHFGIDASGRYMAIGNQNSDTILMARIDAGNGRLKPSGVFANAPTPVCMKFLPPA